MSMQIHGNYDQFVTDYAERVKEKQEAERAEKAKEAEKGAEVNNAGRRPEPQDEYISSEKSEKKPTGLYWVGQDENGSRKIFYDDPKAARADEKEDAKADGKEPKVDEDKQGKPAEECVGNTDKVDREIRKLKEKKQALEQQIQSASGDEEKVRQLQKELAQVEQELSQKDNDTYRRQNTVFS